MLYEWCKQHVPKPKRDDKGAEVAKLPKQYILALPLSRPLPLFPCLNQRDAMEVDLIVTDVWRVFGCSWGCLHEYLCETDVAGAVLGWEDRRDASPSVSASNRQRSPCGRTVPSPSTLFVSASSSASCSVLWRILPRRRHRRTDHAGNQPINK